MAEFIALHIVSVEQLEVLLLLHRERERVWTPAEINRQLRSHEASIEKWLGVLGSMKLVEGGDGGHRFGSPASELASVVDELAAAYRERPIRIVELIFSRPNENLLSFAQAFKLRKRP